MTFSRPVRKCYLRASVDKISPKMILLSIHNNIKNKLVLLEERTVPMKIEFKNLHVEYPNSKFAF
jgi:hypothetical protein